MNYLDLSGSRAPSFFLHSFRLFSWFLDEGEWFVHDWCVVHMSGQGAGGAGCWTPGGCGALRPVKHCRRCLLSHFTSTPAQCPLSPETENSNLIDIFCAVRLITVLILNYNSFTDLSSNVRPLSWLRLRFTGYTVGTRARSFAICLYLSSLLRWG